MISGFMNPYLLPIVPVSVRKENGDWLHLDVLLDTGFNGEIALEHGLVSEYGLAAQPKDDMPEPIGLLQTPISSTTISSQAVELELGDTRLLASVHLLDQHPFSGQLGTALLLNRRITLDVVENGAVNIDWTPLPRHRPGILQKLGVRKWQLPHPEYMTWWIDSLPWMNVSIKDGAGRWRSLSATVDTGDSGELRLPSNYVERLGLKFRDKTQVQNIRGPAEESCGRVEIIWNGRKRPVHCTEHQEDIPPVVGMKLFSGNRVTIDVNHLGTAVKFSRIPRSFSLRRSLFRSLSRRFHFNS